MRTQVFTLGEMGVTSQQPILMAKEWQVRITAQKKHLGSYIKSRLSQLLVGLLSVFSTKL